MTTCSDPEIIPAAPEFKSEDEIEEYEDEDRVFVGSGDK